MAHLTKEEALAVLELSRLPAWKVLSRLKSSRLEKCRTALETTDNYKFEQGRAAELRFDLSLEDTAQAVLDPRRDERHGG